MEVLAALSTGHKVGLAVVAASFIAFALGVSFLAPRWRPDFPGRNGLSVFVIVSLVFFGAMLAAVAVFGKESEAKGAEATAGEQGSAAAAKTIKVSETEFKITLPALSQLSAGKYTFVVTNNGKIQHDLAITGGSVAGPEKTPLLSHGQTAKLTVSLQTGNYQLYCTVPGHRAAGMLATLSIR